MKTIRFSSVTLSVISIISFIVLAAGAILALGSNFGLTTPTTTPSQPQTVAPKPDPAPVQQGEWRIVAIGDSLTRGTGDVQGNGYVGYLQQGLESRGEHVSLHNAAINGLVSSELAAQMNDPELKKQLSAATLILMSIGGNDLVRSVPNVTTPTLEQTRQAQEAYLQNLNTVLKTVRSANNKAPILMVGLYNPFLQIQEGSQGTAIVEDWNARTTTMLRKYKDAIMVPTSDIFTTNGENFLADDHFHPNTAGYKAIAARMLQDLPE